MAIRYNIPELSPLAAVDPLDRLLSALALHMAHWANVLPVKHVNARINTNNSNNFCKKFIDFLLQMLI